MRNRKLTIQESVIVLVSFQAMYWGIVLCCLLASKWGLW